MLFRSFLAAQEPLISVDTKKKELVGNFKNNGREWRPKDRPELVNVHDFIDPKLGRAVPYGIYDITNNVGWVSVGTDHDTASFAVNAIRRWWKNMGKKRHPKATRLMISADGGGVLGEGEPVLLCGGGVAEDQVEDPSPVHVEQVVGELDEIGRAHV